MSDADGADSSLPPPQLPILGGASQSQSQFPGDPAEDSPDEADLFGSGEEDEPPRAPGVAGASQPGGLLDDQPSGRATADDVDEEDLFGKDDDGAQVDEKDLFGSDDEKHAVDEKDLFGSDEDDDGTKPAATPASPIAGSVRRSVAPSSELSAMDERDVFGDMSDDEPEKIEDVILRRRPAPSGDRTFMSLRLPNILSAEKTAFNPKTWTPQDKDLYHEKTDTMDKTVIKLNNPENCIRWRFKKDSEGQMLTDEDGRPQYESNTRIVEWEDGTMHFVVGGELYNTSKMSDNVLLFEENSADVSVCHGHIGTRLVITPTSLHTKTHDSLKRTQFARCMPNSRSLLISTDDQIATQDMQALEMEDKKRRERKRALDTTGGIGGPGINAAFLEDDDDAVGPSIQDLKRQHKAAAVP